MKTQVGRARWRPSISVACGGVAAAIGAMTAALSAPSVSALVKVASSDPIHQFVVDHDPGFQFITTADHYDGVYYYAIATDPFARGEAHGLIDLAAYRYGHPLHGWAAWVLSAGCARWVPLALFTLSLIGLFLAGWAMSELAQERVVSGWVGLAVACSPGLLFAVSVDTTETLGAALVLSALLAWQRGRWGAAAVLIAACCFDKEQYVSVPLGLAVWEVARSGWRVGRVSDLRRKLVAVVTGPAALSAWYVYVHAQFDRWPSQYGPGNLGWPGVGLVTSFVDGRRWAAPATSSGLRWARSSLPSCSQPWAS